MLMATKALNHITKYLNRYTKAAPLAVFRILFGLLMVISLIRFWLNGWIETIYIEPAIHFHYGWFPFIEVPGKFTYLLFIITGISALCVSIGYKYRFAIVFFFLGFSYIELLDKTTYLNHYYFISVISFILIWLPAQAYFSIDAKQDSTLRSSLIPQWQIDVLKLMLAIVYIYAGLAKLNSDWLLNAMPLTIWLPTKFNLPILGSLMHEKWMHYLFSWGGAIYDLSIVFLLLWSRTRIFGFILVLIFHILTRALFPIGMFPYIMIISSLIFFSADFHERLINWMRKIIKHPKQDHETKYSNRSAIKLSLAVLSVFMIIQLALPLRHLCYNENVFWTERGYRYAWRVMLMEKTGYANFKILDGQSGKRFFVQNQDFLTPLQEKEMSTQPDFILEYGKYLGEHFSSQGHENVQVFVESYASLNGRPSQVFIDPKVNLMNVDYTTLCEKHITPIK